MGEALLGLEGTKRRCYRMDNRATPLSLFVFQPLVATFYFLSVSSSVAVEASRC